MKTKQLVICSFVLAGLTFFMACAGGVKKEDAAAQLVKTNDWNGFETEVLYGKHLVDIMDCNVCHTPKVMTDRGPVFDTTRTLSGHPADLPLPDIDRSVPEKIGSLMSDGDMTAFMGPWGVSFAANLTPDPTGLGNWDFAKFKTTINAHKYKGIKEGRDLLPPMPYFESITDGELNAIYAYLRTVKPIHNIVPASLPPTTVASK